MDVVTSSLTVLRDVGRAVGANGIAGAIGAAAAAAAAAAGAIAPSSAASGGAAIGAGEAAQGAARDAGWFAGEQAAWADTLDWDQKPWWQKIFSSPPPDYKAPMKPIGGPPSGNEDYLDEPVPICNTSGRPTDGCNGDNPT